MIKLITAAIVLSSISKQVEQEVPKLPQLKLDQETYITDKTGVINPSLVIRLTVGSSIRIYLPDGTMFTGYVKETSMSDKRVFKVFGELNNKANTGFGIVLTEEGLFGAIVDRNNKKNWVIRPSDVQQGHVFVPESSTLNVP